MVKKAHKAVMDWFDGEGTKAWRAAVLLAFSLLIAIGSYYRGKIETLDAEAARKAEVYATITEIRTTMALGREENQVNFRDLSAQIREVNCFLRDRYARPPATTSTAP